MDTVIKQRRFPVTTSKGNGAINNLLARLKLIRGVEQVEHDDVKNNLIVRFDLLHTNSRSIREIIQEMDLAPKRNFFEKIRWSAIYYTEQNERDAFNAPAMACCSHPDKLLERGRERTKHASCH